MYYELKPMFDKAKSFYGKARTEVLGENKVLYSYVTKIAQIKNDKARVFLPHDTQTISATSLRHIKEFLKQNGFKAETKKQILADYLDTSTQINWFYGVPDIEFIYYNGWDDPSVKYKGYTFNYFDLEDSLNTDYQEDNQGFDSLDAFIENNHELVYDTLNDMIFFKEEAIRQAKERVIKRARFY